VACKESGELDVRSFGNHDFLIDAEYFDMIPLMTIDIWANDSVFHFTNIRPNLLDDIWQIIDWKKVAERYKAAKGT